MPNDRLPALPPRPTVKEVLAEQAAGRAHGKTSHFIKEFAGETLEYIAELERQLRTKDITIAAEQELRVSAENRVLGLEREIREAREVLNAQRDAARESVEKLKVLFDAAIMEAKRYQAEAALATERARHFNFSGDTGL
jgi:translation initiation factor 2B subunit (eIF-2B alpha/beta/delta family)